AVGESRQLVVVGREKGAAAQPRRVVEVLDHGLGEGDAVGGGGPPPHLVQDDQRGLGGVAQDAGGLRHLDHEGGQAGRQVVVGADPGEYAIGEADRGGGGRHEA